MNPVIPQHLHNNIFLLPQKESAAHQFEPRSTNIESQRQSPPHSVAYGSLLPPSSSIARVVMGNSSSAQTSDNNYHISSQQADRGSRQQGRPTARSNLSVLLDEQEEARLRDIQQTTRELKDNEQTTTTGSLNAQDEADSASGPPPPRMKSTRSEPSVCLAPRSACSPRSKTPPPPIIQQFVKTRVNPENPSQARRCMSSKELGKLASSSESPYTTMLQQKEELECKMADLLQKKRESLNGDNSQSSSLVDNTDDSSSLGSSRRVGRMTNESRNRRRALHNRAVVDDLCQIVTDLFIAESKLLNSSMYGVESNARREIVLKNVQQFVASLPPRYALGAETPSEVLLHMRLVAAARSDPSRAVVHIMKLEDESSQRSNLSDDGRSRRLVTIACSDATGLLEYISKLLATSGSHVVDADVMLSSDNIVLDRFVVEMHGRLRLNKLTNYIESFLEEAKRKNSTKNGEVLIPVVPANESSSDASHKSERSATVYFQPARGPQEIPTPQQIREQIEMAVPLAEVLASQGSSGRIFSSQSNSNSFAPLTRHLSLPPLPMDTPVSASSLPSPTAKTPASLTPFSFNQCEPSAPPERQFDNTRNKRRPLVNREGSWDLNRSLHEPDEPPCEYLTLDGVPGSNIEKRVLPLIPFDELMLIETLGMGRVSTIYRAVWQRSTIQLQEGINMLALKVAMVNPTAMDTSHVDELRREADIGARLRHPNICDLTGIAADSECFCLAYEFCEGGSLLSLLSDASRYYEYLPIALDVANGMAYLHSRNVIHRDLKPSNILLTRDHRAKIADFGMSVANTGQELTAETGTYRYMAPEVIRHESYSSNADVYSFGICLWQLITRKVPFATMTPIQAAYAVAEGHRPPIPSSTPHRLQEIITACWDQDSHKRPSFTYIAMALADYAKMAFSPANVGAQTLQIANEMLANVEGNSTVNVDFSTPVAFGSNIYEDMNLGSDVGLEI